MNAATIAATACGISFGVALRISTGARIIQHLLSRYPMLPFDRAPPHALARFRTAAGPVGCNGLLDKAWFIAADHRRSHESEGAWSPGSCRDLSERGRLRTRAPLGPRLGGPRRAPHVEGSRPCLRGRPEMEHASSK